MRGGALDGLARFRIAGGGGKHLALQVLRLAIHRFDRDLEVWPGERHLEVVACRLQVAAVAEQMAAKRGQPVAERRVGPLQIEADVELALARVEHGLAKGQA